MLNEKQLDKLTEAQRFELLQKELRHTAGLVRDIAVKFKYLSNISINTIGITGRTKKEIGGLLEEITHIEDFERSYYDESYDDRYDFGGRF